MEEGRDAFSQPSANAVEMGTTVFFGAVPLTYPGACVTWILDLGKIVIRKLATAR